jgi:asparagine synthase (glutamine-hydrolysing)
MCGIAGMFSFRGGEVDGSRLKAMADAIAHRGPDAEGFFRAPGVGLAHRRLSIIDLEGGRQPLGNEDGSVQIVFNGEIYNFADLTRRLVNQGHDFRTRSDTEAIVHLYEELGADAVTQLRGMFAFAIWDRARQRLLLARDRLGEKPLYFGVRDGILYFGSELKALLAARVFAREPDREAIEHYLALGYVPAPRTAIAGISKLAPGSLLLADARSGAFRVERYWCATAPAEARDGPDAREDELVARFGARLDEAVRGRMISDVPLGAFLSGGLDSSAVAASMAEAGAGVRTFTVGFDEARHDESEDARRVAEHLGTIHRRLEVTADALAVIPRLVWHFDEPFADSSAIPSYYVCKAAREHVTVVLTGDGGDEVFGGYRRYLPDRADRLEERLPGALRSAAAGLARLLPPGFAGRDFARYAARPAPDRYVSRIGIFTYDERDELLAAPARSAPEELLGSILRREGRTRSDAEMLADLRTYLPEDILVKVDRMSMAHGLETRPPLIDHVLVEEALGLDVSWKIRRGVQKYLLRRMVERRLPASTLGKAKHGFSAPVAEWLRGPLAPLAGRILEGQRARDRGLLREAEVARLLAEHRAGRRDHSTKIWALLMLELWFRTYIDAEPSLDAARAQVAEIAAAA